MKVITKPHRKPNAPEPADNGKQPIDPTRNFEVVRPIKLTEITPDPDQVRTHFEPAKLQELADSLKEIGQLQPALVYQDEKTHKYVILCGERRFRAADYAGLKTLNCVVVPKPATRAEILVLQLAENDQRHELEPTDRASSYAAILQATGKPAAWLAERLGVKQSTVSKRLSLLKLNHRVASFVDAGKISESIGYSLSRVADEVRQTELALRVMDEGLTRDQVEAEIAAQARANELPGQGALPMEGPPPANVPTTPAELPGFKVSEGARIVKPETPAGPERPARVEEIKSTSATGSTTLRHERPLTWERIRLANVSEWHLDFGDRIGIVVTIKPDATRSELMDILREGMEASGRLQTYGDISPGNNGEVAQ
jgi:ParB/RepB/Spo0J family partition protein